MNGLADKLPRSEVAELLESRLADIDAKGHADRLIADGALPKKALENPQNTRADLILGLERAALYYWFGQSVDEGIKHNATQRNDPLVRALEELGVKLKLPPPQRPESHADRAFIWIMGVVWHHLGGKVGTATRSWSHRRAGEEMANPFTRFCNSWLEHIHPDERKPPGRKKYRRAIERAEKAGAITRRHK